VAAAIISCNAALAHVTVQPADAPADSYAHLTFTVPHGCNGSATTALRIKLPEGILSAKPQMKTGWNVEIKSRKLETPAQGPHGKIVTDVVEEVAWRGGRLPDNLYDTFGLVVRLPDQAGRTSIFPLCRSANRGSSAGSKPRPQGRALTSWERRRRWFA
jgi:uncharacterized protein YcnI